MAMARCLVEAAYLLGSFAAVTLVGDPILVMMLHAPAAAAVAAARSPGIARLKVRDDYAFVAQAALFHTFTIFFTFQVLASPGLGIETFVVTSALVSCAAWAMKWLQYGDAKPTKRTFAAWACILIGSFVHTMCTDSSKGRSEFPTTEFAGGTACILLFFALYAACFFKQVEKERNERIDKEEEACVKAAALAAATPAAELPPPPPPPSTRLDNWSRIFYANAIGFFYMLCLALLFRVPKPYEEAVLSGAAGAALLASCVGAALAAHADATSPPDAERSSKRALMFALARAMIVFVSWELRPRSGPRAATGGVFLCLVGEAFSRPRPQPPALEPLEEPTSPKTPKAFELLDKADIKAVEVLV